MHLMVILIMSLIPLHQKVIYTSGPGVIEHSVVGGGGGGSKHGNTNHYSGGGGGAGDETISYNSITGTYAVTVGTGGGGCVMPYTGPTTPGSVRRTSSIAFPLQRQ